jgi:hypothetical protein
MDPRAKEWALSVNLIPIAPRGKKPLIEWKKYQEEFSWDEREKWKKEWPDMNYGLVCGSISGVVAIDFDGEEGKALFNEHKVAGTAPVSITPNGYHALYMIPDEPIGNATAIVPGMDFRGEGGYIVIPPSIHPSGKRYQWQVAPWVLRPAPPLPAWFWELWNAKQAAERAVVQKAFHNGSMLSFDEFAREHGCEVPPGGWVADGRIRRCPAAGPDGKIGRADGSYKVHLDHPVQGYIQNHHKHQALLTQAWRPIQ